VNTEDVERLAEDLREHAALTVEFLPDSDPEGLHILRINHVDFSSMRTAQDTMTGGSRSSHPTYSPDKHSRVSTLYSIAK
jgi:hypothetical protein